MRARLLTITILLMACGSAAADNVGKATSITTSVTGTSSGAVKPLRNGDEIFLNDQIETDDKGIGQFEFRDNTKLAVGPGSKVKIDEFVFAGGRGAAAVTVELGKGAFRFISGNSQKTAYKIVTPAATVGVRGTAFDVYVAENGEMAVAMINGQVEVCPRGSACRLHGLVGQFLHLAPGGVFSLRRSWDGSFLRGVPFNRALPFIANQNVLAPGFRSAQNVANIYLGLIPGLGKGPGIVPNIIPVIPSIPNPFR
jgi:ferric-dicitrate binding protein FerR (iron transport regulator)